MIRPFMFVQTSTPRRPIDLALVATRNTGAWLTRTATRLCDAVSGRRPTRRCLALAQGGYYVLTGVWPFLHMRSFEAVTGPKTDHWLVQTVGALVGTLGGTLLAGSLHTGGPSRDLASAAAASALALALLDGVFVAQQRIAPVYLLDAVAECILAAGWLAAYRSDPSSG